ncbi:MAG: pyrimidine/purine nucleoside phosphorylase [Sulfurimonas sp.]|nr:pyrimidine/purine nucleoside phosphorylase [Sulfurimonas sp.]
MSTIENATIVKKANIYYDGKVTSRSVNLADGTVQSLGIMLPGEYTFNTDEAEIMEIMSGDLEIKLPNEEWKTLNTPESFNVPANSSFDLKIKTVTDYCCSYISK